MIVDFQHALPVPAAVDALVDAAIAAGVS